MSEVKICDVTLRDGLQVMDRRAEIDVAQRLELLDALQRAGLPYLEVGSMVHPKIMPSMKDTPQILEQLTPTGGEIAVLVPKVSYYRQLASCPNFTTVALFVSASESYSRLNTRMSNEEALAAAREVAVAARADGYRTRAYLSCAFRDTGDDAPPMAVDDVARACNALLAMGCENVALSDTGGTATPADIARITDGLAARLDLSKMGVHLHDRYGLGIANAWVAYQHGIRCFDSSVGGIGGNKSSKKGVGNIATEELVFLFDSAGVGTGAQIGPLLEAGALVDRIAAQLGTPLPPSRILRNGVTHEELVAQLPPASRANSRD